MQWPASPLQHYGAFQAKSRAPVPCRDLMAVRPHLGPLPPVQIRVCGSRYLLRPSDGAAGQDVGLSGHARSHNALGIEAHCFITPAVAAWRSSPIAAATCMAFTRHFKQQPTNTKTQLAGCRHPDKPEADLLRRLRLPPAAAMSGILSWLHDLWEDPPEPDSPFIKGLKEDWQLGLPVEGSTLGGDPLRSLVRTSQTLQVLQKWTKPSESVNQCKSPEDGGEFRVTRGGCHQAVP